jgi:hypothetical protein
VVSPSTAGECDFPFDLNVPIDGDRMYVWLDVGEGPVYLRFSATCAGAGDGWCAADEDTVRLRGGSCTSFLASDSTLYVDDGREYCTIAH